MTDDEPATAKIHFVTAFIKQLTDSTCNYPWFVEGDDTLSLVHRGTVWGEKPGPLYGAFSPINIMLIGIFANKDHPGHYWFHAGIKLFEMFDFAGGVNSSGTGILYAGWSRINEDQALKWNTVAPTASGHFDKESGIGCVD